jgi:hypothetical protein
MGIKAKLSSSTNYNVKVSPSANYLQTGAPVALRNIAADKDVVDIADIGNVTVVNKTDGAGLQYNSVTNKYEIRLMDIDGGSF